MSWKKKIYIGLFCFSVFFAITIGFGVFPFLEELKKSSQELNLQQATLDLLQSRLKNLEDLQKEYLLYQPTLKNLQNSFVAPDAPIEFIEFLEKEAKNLNLLIKISPLTIPQQKDDPWLSVGFSVTLGGPFPDCLMFLERLEQSPFLVEISQLNIERIAERRTPPKGFETLKVGDVTFRLILKAFSGQIPPKNKK
jgi:hypothetical protein